VQGGKLTDNVDAKDSGFSGDDGDNKRKALKGLYCRIASKSKLRGEGEEGCGGQEGEVTQTMYAHVNK
jgi:hypothetical protein